MSNEIKTGGPAFPEIRIQKGDNYNPSIKVYYPGMKLRDYFAAKALPEIMRTAYEGIDQYGIKEGASTADVKLHAAKEAYSWADAMLAAREGKV